MAAQPFGQGVYWVGQDGNTYMKASDLNGVVQWHAPLLSPTRAGLTQIADPLAPTPQVPSGGGGSSEPAPNQAAVDNTQRAIAEIPGLLKAALASEAQTYDNTNAGFNAQQDQQQKTYDTSTTTNQQNYDSNFMDSIRAGIKGLGGLMALLRGTGAGGGTADQQVRDVVGGVTANDIRTGADTQKENQTALDSSLSSFLGDLRQKREENKDTHVNNERAIRRSSNSQLQDLYSRMAGYYGDAGNTAQRDAFMAGAGGLTPEIAADTRSQVSKYDTTPVVIHAPNLTAFSAPTQPNVVAAPSDNSQVGSGIFTISAPDRRKDQTPALAGY